MQLYTKILLGMSVGILLGLLVGPNSMLLPQGGVSLTEQAKVYVEPDRDAETNPLASNVRQARVREVLPPEGDDPSEWLVITWSLGNREILKRRSEGEQVDVKPGEIVTGYVRLESENVQTFAPIGQFLIGATEWVGRLFLGLIKMVVVPLVFCSLAVGVASLGDVRRLGRIGGRTLGLFTVTTCISLTIGVSLANLIGPGRFVGEADRAGLMASYTGEARQSMAKASEAPGLIDQLLSIVPANPVNSLASGNMLQIIFFALALGIALTLLVPAKSKPVADALTGINEAMIMLVHLIMHLAPYGVAALLFKVVGTTGLSVLLALGVYSGVVVLGLVMHAGLVYHGLVRFLAGLPFLPFLAGIRDALMVAFSTSSSSATLPVTKECCEQNLGVSSEVSSFVLPLGATVNMDGTGLYQGVAAIFIAQIYGMDLSFVDQVTIVGTATLASVGAAGVPGAGIITLAMVLTSIGAPTEGIALILGVDRLLDMFRTTVNVVGDSAVTTVMGKLEGDQVHVPARKTPPPKSPSVKPGATPAKTVELAEAPTNRTAVPPSPETPSLTPSN